MIGRSSRYFRELLEGSTEGKSMREKSKVPLTFRCGVLIIIFSAFSIAPQEAYTQIDPLFQEKEILNIELIGPFFTINKERDKETKYPGGTLSYFEDEKKISLDVKYIPRGNNRLSKDTCSYAQLWLDFKSKKVKDTLFKKQNKLKLVVQCKNNRNYETYLIKEFQAYRIFNILSNTSFRSRLLNIKYVDTDKNTSRRHLGMIIEEKSRLAKRTGLKAAKIQKIKYQELDAQQGNLVSLFMYMIGNTDYSIISSNEGSCCHNSKLLLDRGKSNYLPVPYDFDSSGYVNTSYALPSDSFRIRNVRQRLYRGFCTPEKILTKNLNLFREKRQEILAIATDQSQVTKRVAKSSSKYIEAFYKIINNPKDLQKRIKTACRGKIL